MKRHGSKRLNHLPTTTLLVKAGEVDPGPERSESWGWVSSWGWGKVLKPALPPSLWHAHPTLDTLSYPSALWLHQKQEVRKQDSKSYKFWEGKVKVMVGGGEWGLVLDRDRPLASGVM